MTDDNVNNGRPALLFFEIFTSKKDKSSFRVSMKNILNGEPFTTLNHLMFSQLKARPSAVFFLLMIASSKAFVDKNSFSSC